MNRIRISTRIALILSGMLLILLLSGCLPDNPDDAWTEDAYVENLYTWDPGTSTWVKAGSGGGGAGDMTKAVYDPDDDGVITKAQLDPDIIYEGDSRLTDDRDPNAHAASHAVGGSDTIFPADPAADKFLMWDDSETTLSWGTSGTDYVKPGVAINGNLPLASGYNVDIVASLTSDHTWSGITMTFTAGEDLTIGQPVYLKFSDGKVYKANATDSTTMPCIGISTGSINQNTTGTILMYGSFRDDSWNWSSGYIFVDTTTGTLTQTAPSASSNVVEVIGTALTADILLFNPVLMPLTVK